VYTTLLLIPWFKLHGWPIVGKLEIQPFGILVAAGILLGTRVAEWRAQKTGVDPRLISDFLVYTIGIGLACAYLLNKPVYDWDEFKEIVVDPKLFFHRYMGLSSFMGFMGGVGAAFLFRYKKRVSIMVMGDLFCFAFPFAWFFGRMGCFTVHDHPGLVSHFFLAVDNYNGEGLPRHDLGFYEVLWSAAAVALNLWLGTRKLPRGFFMAFIPLFYAPVRFGLDYLREIPINGGDVRYYGFTPGQYCAVVMFIAGLAVAIRIARGPAATIYIDGTDGPALPEAATPAATKSQPPKKKRKK
jgi:phosphatidylglycerol:prolipoprotein diacylglycerol transferase